MPLTKLSTSYFRAASRETLAVNAEIDKYNTTSNPILLETIQALIDRPGRVHWASQASEILRLELAINQLRRANAGGGGAADALGPRAIVNLAPTAWLERLSLNAPSLEGIQFEGTGKQGAQGNTHKMLLPGGKKLFGKTARGADKNSAETEVQREYAVYKRFYATVGGHPNLVQVWGWADMKIGVQHEVGFIMDHIEGPDGRTMQGHLKEAWDLGIISSAEYWSAIQYVGRCHVEVIRHLKAAGWAHNDIKPENYVIDSITGEVIVIDLGGAGLLGEKWNAVTVEYLAPEMLRAGKANRGAMGAVASDVFSLGASLAHAVEAPHAFHGVAQPNRGLTHVPTPPKGDRSAPRAYRETGAGAEGVAAGRYKNQFQYGAETDYTRQLKRMMNENPLEREKTIDEHASNKFLNDSILTDEQTREVMKGIASGARKRAWEDKWRRAGKVPPTAMTMDRLTIASKLKDKIRPYSGNASYGEIPPTIDVDRARREETDLLRKRRDFDEIAKLINQANAFGINTSQERLIMKKKLAEFVSAERAIKAALGRAALPGAPVRR